MMKYTKKLFALLLAVLMVAALAVPALAADPTTYTVTISKDATDKAAHTYGAYQIFTGKLETVDGKKVLSDIQWGTGIDTTKVGALITELNAIDGVTIASGANAAAVAKAISDANIANDDAKAQAVADALNKALSTTTAGTGSIAADAASGTITGLAAGYYLIKDTGTIAATENGAYTRFILEVVDNVTVAEKANVPTVTKQVKEKNDTAGTESGWQDAADYDIGDAVPFKIEGTLPGKFAEYDTYTTYTITDTLSGGLTAPAAADIHITLDTETGTDISSLFNVAVNGKVITISLKDGVDLKTAKVGDVGFTASSKIIVTYSATLNESGVTYGSAGNENKVKLEYSNNPNYNGSGDKGTTPEDKVVVFTYQINALKVEPTSDAAIDQAAYNALTDAEKADYVKIGDKYQKVTALAGAGFTLYKEVKSGDTVSWEKVGNEIKGVTTFEFKGVDAGKYKLVETTVPAGYNKAADVEITVTAEYDTTSQDPKLKKLTVTPDSFAAVVTAGTNDGTDAITTNGIISGKILNEKGSVLPSTGGIGTTIVSVGGGIRVAAAVILLITKKRVREEN